MTAMLTEDQQKTIKDTVERVYNLEEEKKSLSADITEMLKAAKEKNLDPKVIRLIVKERRLTAHEVREHDETVDAYRHAAGMAV